jgi:hypothetical protein
VVALWLVSAGAAAWACGTVTPPPAPRETTFEELFEFVDEVEIVGSVALSLTSAFDVHVSPAYVYVTLPRANRLYAFTRDGGFVERIGGEGPGPGEFEMPYTSTTDRAGNLYVNDYRQRKVLVFNKHHEFVRDFVYQGQGQRLLLADDQGDDVRLATVGLVGETLIQVYNSHGAGAGPFEAMGTDWPYRAWAVNVAPDGAFYIVNRVQQDVHRFSPRGRLLQTLHLVSPTLHRFTGYDLATPRKRTREDAVGAVRKLQSEKHTRIESLVALQDLILVGVRRYQFEAGVPERAIDVYDRGGQLIYYGMSSPGKMSKFRSDQAIYFVEIDDHGDNYGVVTLRRYRLRAEGR